MTHLSNEIKNSNAVEYKARIMGLVHDENECRSILATIDSVDGKRLSIDEKNKVDSHEIAKKRLLEIDVIIVSAFFGEQW